ncbi:SMI1/KNR4 family protein [Streptomyces yaizuensis]|uniref:SMI1/KNR4 family protein n=1 Tax=Streptomyces yaizuensis TaxID=2989713 RepID=A0ABQ5PBK2_9ACTN|nr:SMI1/KNR4 family protein [Streptomyces sp. YSPA8]GLF99606.1 SMI1/KNR4 family protein [Streptomyces sp. YSPA8]
MNDFEELIARVAAASAAGGRLRPPVSAAELAEAERALGFPLHPLLAALYWRVGNGGFGPDEAVLPLSRVPGPAAEAGAVDEYTDRTPPSEAEPWWSWPEGVLPILDWGCAMFACVDCRSPDGTVLLFEPNAITDEDVSTAWFVDAGSLAAWLETWLDGRGWYEEEAPDGDSGMAPWTEGPSRLAQDRQTGRPVDR